MEITLPGAAFRDDLTALACQTTVCGDYTGDWTMLPIASECPNPRPGDIDPDLDAADISDEAWANLTTGPLKTVTATLSRTDAVALGRRILYQAAGELPVSIAVVLDALSTLLADLVKLLDQREDEEWHRKHWTFGDAEFVVAAPE